MERAWEKNVRRVTPYVPGEQPKEQDVIKLNTNENPYPPSPEVTKALQRMDAKALRRYPDPAASALTSALAKRYQVKDSQVFAGVGSDDVLAMCFLTFFHGGKPILFPDITYSFYDVWAELFEIPYRMIPLREDFTIAPKDFLRENGGIVFPNPNAPTGIPLSLNEVETIIRGNPDVVVIVDEAYIDFGAESALPLLESYENLLIVQTFSKSRSLAGIRIGYALGNECLIKHLNDVKYSFNSYTLNQAAIAAGTAAVLDEEYYQKILGRIVSTRERVKEELHKLHFSFPDSKANFLFVTHESCPAEELFEALKQEKIYVRYFHKPRIENYLRITIGTDEQMDVLVSFLKRYLEKRNLL